MSAVYDEYASAYDQWFMNNENLFVSEAKMVAKAMEGCGRTLSIGCGSGLFESYLKRECGIVITDGVEPSEAMAAIARKRGMNVTIGAAEAFVAEKPYETIMFNGCPSYIADLGKAFRNAYASLVPGGRIAVMDVPKESGYALIYNLAMTLGTWDHPLLDDIKPPDPYPIEFVKSAHWRTRTEIFDCLKAAGFVNYRAYQTLTRYPCRSNDSVEEPMEGCDRGSYVAIVAEKPADAR